MNRCLSALAAGAGALAMVAALSSCGVLGGPPGSVQVQADSTGAAVIVLWTQPTEGPADLYSIHFTPLGGVEEHAGDTVATACRHDPQGRTGSYRVEAHFGADRYSAPERPSTVPVFTDTVRINELNVTSGRAGFGFSRTTGQGTSYDMRVAGNADKVDFYLTDTRSGSNSRPYTLFSPTSRGKDQGAAGVIPDAAWRAGYYSDHRADEQAVLPAVAESLYFDYTDINDVPFNAACYLAGGYFALVKVVKVNTDTGYARLVAWFQAVPGLRLISH
ncbi:MAG: hypothetical protein R6X12_03430 [bacterium]